MEFCCCAFNKKTLNIDKHIFIKKTACYFLDWNNLNKGVFYETIRSKYKWFRWNVKKEEYNYADYVIIYGCSVKQLLDERLNYAINILSNIKFDKVVVTGGIGKKGYFNEAEYMREFLIRNSIDDSKIITENESKTTEENNINIMNMLNLELVDRPTNIVLVTHEYHLARIILH